MDFRNFCNSSLAVSAFRKMDSGVVNSLSACWNFYSHRSAPRHRKSFSWKRNRCAKTHHLGDLFAGASSALSFKHLHLLRLYFVSSRLANRNIYFCRNGYFVCKFFGGFRRKIFAKSIRKWLSRVGRKNAEVHPEEKKKCGRKWNEIACDSEYFFCDLFGCLDVDLAFVLYIVIARSKKFRTADFLKRIFHVRIKCYAENFRSCRACGK